MAADFNLCRISLKSLALQFFAIPGARWPHPGGACYPACLSSIQAPGMISEIPCVDIRSGASSVSDPDIADALDQALTTHGFCYIRGHDVDADRIGCLLESNHAFHALPKEKKLELAVNRFHRGYIGKNESQTVTSSVTPATQPNQSESFMVMQPIGPDHPRWGSAIFGPNQWPDALIPEFRMTCLDYLNAMQALAYGLTQRLGVALGLGPDAFTNWFTEPTLFLRLLRYPALRASDHQDQFGSAPHTDHGFLTLVAQDARVRVSRFRHQREVGLPYPRLTMRLFSMSPICSQSFLEGAGPQHRTGSYSTKGSDTLWLFSSIRISTRPYTRCCQRTRSVEKCCRCTTGNT